MRKACLEEVPEFPDPQGFYNGPSQYRQSADLKLRTLKNFEKVARYLEPQDPIISHPTLWHTDLHADNIFVSEEDPTEITAIIDWQAVHIAPLYTQVRHPAFLNFDGEKPEELDASPVKLPENYDSLSPEHQTAAKRLRGAQQLWQLYGAEWACRCGETDDINRAMRFRKGLLGQLPSLVGNVYSDGELLFEDELIKLQQNWDQLVDDPVADPCPLNFTKADIVIHEEEFASWAYSIELMTDFQRRWVLTVVGKAGYHMSNMMLRRRTWNYIMMLSWMSLLRRRMSGESGRRCGLLENESIILRQHHHLTTDRNLCIPISPRHWLRAFLVFLCAEALGGSARLSSMLSSAISTIWWSLGHRIYSPQTLKNLCGERDLLNASGSEAPPNSPNRNRFTQSWRVASQQNTSRNIMSRLVESSAYSS